MEYSLNNILTPMGKQTQNLLDEQQNEWELCSQNYNNLSEVQFKSFHFNDVEIKVQWNPARLSSTSAKVDPRSIKERKCFLCQANRPAEQKGIDICKDYIILVNPFPIFPKHFTITNKQHVPQNIAGSFTRMMEISKDLGQDFLVFYNGPRCGASAPDHMHFQAGNTGFLTLETQLDKIRNSTHADLMLNASGLWYIDDGLRKMIMLEGTSLEEISVLFNTVYESLKHIRGIDEEPMLNLISYYLPAQDKVSVVVFLREKHRPASFFDESENGLLLSPAAVDIGGVCVTPHEKDFRKITAENINSIFNEVFVSSGSFKELKAEIKNRIHI